MQSDVNPSLSIKAYVLRKSEGVDPYSGTFYVDLKIKNDRSLKIASGLFGKAEIFPEYAEKMWLIPYQSLLNGNGNLGYVFVTNDLKKVSKIQVHIFDLEKDSLYVNRGLEGYKYLIVSGSAYLNNNSQIKVINN